MIIQKKHDRCKFANALRLVTHAVTIVVREAICKLTTSTDRACSQWNRACLVKRKGLAASD